MPAVVCPHCSAALKAPDGAAARRFRCPKCKQTITLPDGPPQGIMPAMPPAAPPPLPDAPPIRSRRRDERDDRDNDYDERPRRRYDDDDLAPEPVRSGGDTAVHSLGIGAIVLGVVALPLSMLPCIGMISLPLSGLGLLVGVAGLFVALARGGRGIGFPIAGSAVSGFALLIGAFWLMLAAGTGAAIDSAAKASKNPATVPVKDDTDGGKGDGRNKLDVWAGVGSTAAVGDLEVTLVGAVRNGTVLGQRFGSISNTRCCIIQMKLLNTSKTKVVKFRGWSGDGHVLDEHGNRYGPVTFGTGFAFDARPLVVDDDDAKKAWRESQTIIHARESIHPGKMIVTFVFFESCVEVAEEIRLTLPASEVGGKGDVRLRAKFAR